MNAELPPFKNGDHNSKSASTLNQDITPLMQMVCYSLFIVVNVYANKYVYNLHHQQKRPYQI